MVVTIKGLYKDYAEMFSGDIINAIVNDTEDGFGHITMFRKDITFECNSISVNKSYIEVSIVGEHATVEYRMEISKDIYESIELNV